MRHRKNSSNPLIRAAVVWLGFSSADAATIGTPALTNIPDSMPPHYNLTEVGSQDWAVYGGEPVYVYSPEPSSRKLGGVSISKSVQVTAPCTVGNLGNPSQTFGWLDGGPERH